MTEYVCRYCEKEYYHYISYVEHLGLCKEIARVLGMDKEATDE